MSTGNMETYFEAKKNGDHVELSCTFNNTAKDGTTIEFFNHVDLYLKKNKAASVDEAKLKELASDLNTTAIEHFRNVAAFTAIQLTAEDVEAYNEAGKFDPDKLYGPNERARVSAVIKMNNGIYEFLEKHDDLYEKWGLDIDFSSKPASPAPQ